MRLIRLITVLHVASAVVLAQYVIQTVAGGGPNNVPAVQASLSYPWGVATDSSGNVFLSAGGRIFRVNASGTLTVFAGSGLNGFAGDGGAATGASFSGPKGLAVDNQGNLYVADEANNRIRKVSATTGIVTTVAGDGTGMFRGDGGPAINAGLFLPTSIAVDGSGNIYIADVQNVCVRKVTVATGIISTVAGNGAPGFSGDGGPATNAGFASLQGVAIDLLGNLYIADGLRVRKVSASTGRISTIAGSGLYGYDGDRGPATAAKTSGVAGVSVSNLGDVYFTDSLNNAVRKVDAATQIITTVAITTGKPKGLVLDGAGNLYIADYESQVVRRLGQNGSLTVVAGTGAIGGYSGDGGPAINAAISPVVPAADPAGNLYFSDRSQRVLRVDAATGIISASAGKGGVGSASGDGGQALNAQFTGLRGIVFDSKGNLYIADWMAGNIRRVDASTQVITTYAGVGNGGPKTDGIPATQAMLGQPSWLAVDSADNLYVGEVDSNYQCVRRIDSQTGIITTVAGGGGLRYSGDGGPATSAGLTIGAFAFDSANNLFIADTDNARVRKVDAHTGIITTVAGNGVPTFNGDGGVATLASFSYPTSVAVSANGDLLVGDQMDDRIRRVDALTGKVVTFAGTGRSGLTGDGGPPTAADLSLFYTALDGEALYHTGGDRVRVIAPSGGCFYSLSKSAANFNSSAGAGTFAINTTPGCSWSASSSAAWVTITAGVSGSGSASISYSVAANPNNAPRSTAINVAGRRFTITQGAFAVTMSLSRSSVRCGTTVFGAVATSPQSVSVTFNGAAGVAWTVSASSVNIFLTPASGVGNGTFKVSAVPGASGTVTVIANGISNSPQQVQVTVVTVDPTAPIGSFDTPGNGANGVVGAIGVTGWALDTIEVSKVDIWREPVGAEHGSSNGLVYIGDAVFVDGARPDVEATYPDKPWNYRAGWGYLMLTNGLPNTSGGPDSGNGTYRLHAIAHNKAGLSQDLGVHTITCDNAHASKPFGTIDTPAQGGSISGSSFVNFGWTLTQNPNIIPIDGSTITVTVDGQVLGHPTYNQSRSDIAAAFPGLANSNGAVGYYVLDSTQLTNGLHTIGWVVYDSAGHGEGIGSRFFSVFNSGTNNVFDSEEPVPRDLPQAVTGRKRYDLNQDLEALPRDAVGDYVIEIEELGRIQLHTNATSGYSLVGGERRPLPAGSSLRSGVFRWQAGPGFVGDYSLLLETPREGAVRLKVRIRPRY